MMRLQMITAKPIVWLFGDEAANDLRDSLKAFSGVDIDIRCYAYTGATLESVMDAQLLMAIGSGTLPSAIIVARLGTSFPSVPSLSLDVLRVCWDHQFPSHDLLFQNCFLL